MERPRKAQISVNHPHSFIPGLVFHHPVSSANCKSRSLATIIDWHPIDLHHFVGVQSLTRSHHADRGEAYEKSAPKSEEKGRQTE